MPDTVPGGEDLVAYTLLQEEDAVHTAEVGVVHTAEVGVVHTVEEVGNHIEEDTEAEYQNKEPEA